MAGTLAQKMIENMAKIFDNAAPSPPRKSAKGENAEVRSSAHRQAIGASPFPPEQSLWLSRALGNSMAVFGEEVEGRFKDNEAEIKLVKDELVEVNGHHGELKAWAQKEIDELKKANHDMKAELVHVKDLQSKTQKAPAAAGGNPNRTHAIVGNLGWDENEIMIVSRAKEVLQEAGVPVENYTAIAPAFRTGQKGSMAEVQFVENAALEEARLKVRALTKKFQGGKGAAFVDIKKTFAERRPTRQLRFMETMVWELIDRGSGEAEIEFKDVTCDLRTRSVSVKGCKIAHLQHESLVWTAVGERLLEANVRDRLDAMIEGYP